MIRSKIYAIEQLAVAALEANHDSTARRRKLLEATIAALPKGNDVRVHAVTMLKMMNQIVEEQNQLVLAFSPHFHQHNGK